MTRKVALRGVNALNEPMRLSKDVCAFTDEEHYFHIKKSSPGTVQLTTPKGVYYLKRHTQLNIYQGYFGDNRKMQVSLKKVSGWIGYW